MIQVVDPSAPGRKSRPPEPGPEVPPGPLVGNRIARSGDGSRIVASAPTLVAAREPAQGAGETGPIVRRHPGRKRPR